MRLEDDIDTAALAALGAEAVQLLCAKDYENLADRFGYALAYGRAIPAAIEEDVSRCLKERGATSIAKLHPDAIRVSNFVANSTGLLQLVECRAITDNGATILVELVVTGADSEKYLTLEDVS